MNMQIKHEKLRFWMSWTILSAVFLPVGYFFGYIAGLFVNEAFGYTVYDTGSYLSQIIVYCAFGTVVGLVIGLYQWGFFLKARYNVPPTWVLALVAGIVISEIISGLILWKFEINRSDVGYFQSGSQLMETLIWTFTGLLTGLLQFLVIRKRFDRPWLWILSSMLGWGLCNSVIWTIPLFFVGALVLGAITGGTLIWLMKCKCSS
jgi:hypothetical protein